MSLVWYAIATAAPLKQAAGCLEAWKSQGYATAIIAEPGDADNGATNEDRRKLPADLHIIQPAYKGHCLAVNTVAKAVLEKDPECQIIVTGGDDVYPCRTKRAEAIGMEFIEHFGGTLGVMQPHGDKLHHTHDTGKYVLDTAAWSAWMGREWCERAFMGAGPMHPDFFHYWGDTILQDVAVFHGVYWQRADIIQHDDNWKRSKRRHLGRPPYMYKAKAKAKDDQALYERLKAEGYPGCGLAPKKI